MKSHISLFAGTAVCLMMLSTLPLMNSCKRSTGKKAAEEATAEAAAEDLDAQYATSLLAKGTEAPEFSLQDPEGNIVNLSDFQGKYVVLDFWASWCPDCRADVPALKALWEKYGSEKIAFMGVSFDTDKEAWSGYVKENGMVWTQVSPLAKWKETQVSKDYGVNWIPSMYLIGPDGKVVLGTVMLDKLGKALEDL